MPSGNGSSRTENVTSLLKISLLPATYFFGYEALQKNFTKENGKLLIEKTESVFSNQLNRLPEFPLILLEGMRKGISVIEIKDFRTIYIESSSDLLTALLMGGAGAATNYLLKAEKAKPLPRITFATIIALGVGYGMVTYQSQEAIHLFNLVQKIGIGALGALAVKIVIPPLLDRLNLLESPFSSSAQKPPPKKRVD